MSMRTDPLPISVLFITYKRVPLLVETSRALRDVVPEGFVETVVADDGSSAEEQALIRNLPFDQFILAPKNAGLGANNNAGLRACSADYIFMLQDDWKATSALSGALRQGMWILDNDPSIGMVRFAGGDPADFKLERRSSPQGPYYVCRHDEPGAVRHEHIYSDTPHLRRTKLLDPAVLGSYRQDCAMEECEEDYSRRFEAQSAYYIAFTTNGSLPYFDNIGVSVSHRTQKFRYRLDAALASAAQSSGFDRQGRVYRALRKTWFAVRSTLISIGALK